MTTVSVDTGAPVPAAALDALRSTIGGAVLCPGDEHYEAAAQVWNRAAQRRPRVIVRCEQTADVVTAVRVAREHDLPLAVRGGGYCPAGTSTGTGLVIDLRAMDHVQVDPLGRTAVVGAGATWGAVDAATQRYGFAVPGVPLSRVGVAGSTLGGGFGHLRRAYGLACDALTGADVVLADGGRMTTSGDQSPELLWGLRGGGGNFGVLTSMRFRLAPLPEPVLSGSVFYCALDAAAALRFYRDFTAGLREDITTRVSLYGAPHSAALTRLLGLDPPAPVVAIKVACVGHPDDSARLVEPVRGAARVLVDRLSPKPYPQLQAGGDEAYPAGQSAAVTSCYVDSLSDELIAGLIDRQAAMPAGACELHVHHMGGAVGRVARMSTAAPNRAAPFLVSAMARWDATADEPAFRGWVEATGQCLRRFAVGGPHVGLRSAPVSSVEAYGAERYLRLAALKRRFDPDNVFASNQNIAPLA